MGPGTGSARRSTMLGACRAPQRGEEEYLRLTMMAHGLDFDPY
jgi:hypothetical protein